MRNRSLAYVGVVLFHLVGATASSSAAPSESGPDSPAGPVIWIVGDCADDQKGLDGITHGWGPLLAGFLDPEKCSVRDHSLPAISSRRYVKEGHWKKVEEGLREGDFLLITFGRQDRGIVANNVTPAVDGVPEIRRTARAIKKGPFEKKAPAPPPSTRLPNLLLQGSLPGWGDETRKVEMEDGSAETVRTYGWYLRTMVGRARDKGAKVVIVGPLPLAVVHKDIHASMQSRYQPAVGWHIPSEQSGWAEVAAKTGGAAYLDCSGRLLEDLRPRPVDDLRTLVVSEGLGYSGEGAAIVARHVTAALVDLPVPGMAGWLNERGKQACSKKVPEPPAVAEVSPEPPPAAGDKDRMPPEKESPWARKLSFSADEVRHKGSKNPVRQYRVTILNRSGSESPPFTLRYQYLVKKRGEIDLSEPKWKGTEEVKPIPADGRVVVLIPSITLGRMERDDGLMTYRGLKSAQRSNQWYFMPDLKPKITLSHAETLSGFIFDLYGPEGFISEFRPADGTMKGVRISRN